MPKKLFLKDYYSLFGQLAEKSEDLRKEKMRNNPFPSIHDLEKLGHEGRVRNTVL
ncbi:hypothetical protein [Methanosarcina mazei]|nr:hypothetical protein [Methanosarcina mazei]